MDADNTSGTYDGASWATAYRRLQNALGAGDGQFEVLIPVTPSATGVLSNPRSGGICRVDPDSQVIESAESNNDCNPDSVTTAVAVYLPWITR